MRHSFLREVVVTSGSVSDTVYDARKVVVLINFDVKEMYGLYRVFFLPDSSWKFRMQYVGLSGSMCNCASTAADVAMQLSASCGEC
jgi:hypothetical protein